jgi:methionyl-tRNA synthetase
MGSFYVTTAIPYVNAEPHLGFALELVQADVLARYHRLCGDITWFLTGTDENSLTNVLAAEREGLPVRSLVDRNAEAFRALTDRLQISNDDFIRTATDQRHLEGAQRFWEACVQAGDVYKRHYRGLYCIRCERFYTTEELVEGLCPEHAITPELVEEENYFFRLSHYASRLGTLLASRTLQVLPESRHHEVQAFVARGLTDFSISRTRVRARGWGIPVPDDPDQVIYVWFDALTNYITGLGFGTDPERYRRYWMENPNRTHVIGKDILRFHAVNWPAMLLSAGQPLPTTIVVHGFLTTDGRRMSKTLGTGIDPVALTASWGVDAVRYWLLREVPPVDDTDYTYASFSRAYTADLANALGNLLQRTVSMIHRYRGGVVPMPTPAAASLLRSVAEQLPVPLHRSLRESWDPRLALEAVFSLVRSANRLVEEMRPWALARGEREGNFGLGRQLNVVLWELAECLRLVAEALRPFLPGTAGAIATQLGVTLDSNWSAGLRWGGLGAGTQVLAPTPLFPRRDP